MHHVLANHFKTIFGFQQNLSSKVSLLLIEKVISLAKASLLQRKKYSKTLSISFLFTKKAILTPFSTQFYSNSIYEMI